MSGVTMGDRHDYVALDWVKGEISETLNQARQALEAFVENPEDTTRLRFCLTYIHQVHGTLQMVEFYGAALLAEEMEKLAQALMRGTCSRQAEALEVLMQAILQMPSYLDRVQSGRRDVPVLLLPLLNDMRSARDEKLLTETAVFNPQLRDSEAEPVARVDFASPTVTLQLRKLRQALQITHAAILRGQDVERNSHQLGRVFVRLEQLFQRTRYAELWGAFAGVAEGLEHGSIENGAAYASCCGWPNVRCASCRRKPAISCSRTPVPSRRPNCWSTLPRTGARGRRLRPRKGIT